MSVVCFLDMIEHLDLELVTYDIRLKGIVHLQMLVPIDLHSVFFFFYQTMEVSGDQQMKVNYPFMRTEAKHSNKTN